MLWNLIQQAQLGDTRDRHASLEERVRVLEDDLDRISEILTEVIRYLEQREGRDIDGDGRVG